MGEYDESISDLVDAVISCPSDLVVLMSAYADASEADGNLIVAFVVFRASKVKAFEKDVKRLLDAYNLPFFRMSACNSHKYPFDRIKKEECDVVSREMHRLIAKYASFSFFNAVKLSVFNKVIPVGNLIDTPYGFLVYGAILSLNKISKSLKKESSFSFFFETGDDGEKDANVVLGTLFSKQEWREKLAYRSHTFLNKSSIPTQAADVLAWHASKQISRIPKGLDMRGDFKYLYDKIELHWAIYDETTLRRLVDSVNDKGGGPGSGKVAYQLLHGTAAKLFRDRSLMEKMIEG